MNTFTRILNGVTGRQSTPHRAPRRCTPAMLESMEGRTLMSATPITPVDAATSGDADDRPTEEVAFIKSWSTSGDADDRPTEEVAFYYNKIAFNYAATQDSAGRR